MRMQMSDTQPTQDRSFEQARDAAAEKHARRYGTFLEAEESGFTYGAHWCAAHLAEQAGREFDPEPIREAAIYARDDAMDVMHVKLVVEGARYQHQRDWARIAELEAEVKNCIRLYLHDIRVVTVESERDIAIAKLTTAEATVAKLREALEFYADPGNWRESVHYPHRIEVISDEDVEIVVEEQPKLIDGTIFHGGKRARQALEGVKDD
jgi:hypothetical protein